MIYERIVISSGHGKYVRGACGILDEVEEARRVVNRVAEQLTELGVSVTVFHDDTSHSQNENLNTIVNFHNAQTRDLDISVHFNAYVETTKAMGTECLYVTQNALAANIATAIADCGLVNRGAKKRTDLFFLNNTEMPAILIETCFVDSTVDAEVYLQQFDAICEAITGTLAGEAVLPSPEPEPEPDVAVNLLGKVSWFGGPNDEGVAPDEGLAFIHEVGDAPQLFLDKQPPGTTGLARRLDPDMPYIACRWDYDETPRDMLLNNLALVRASKTGRSLLAYPADWGPHKDTGRIADISPCLLESLGINTDDEVQVTFPAK